MSNRPSPPQRKNGDNENDSPGGTGGSTPNLMCGLRVRRVALAEPSLPYAKIKRPVGAKSRVPVECGGEDWDRACGDAITRVMFVDHRWFDALPHVDRSINPKGIVRRR
jgi:hypothetical protein